MKDDIKQTSLAHHSLRVWHYAVELTRLVGKHRIENATLRDQAIRAVTSVGLNISEGAGRDGKTRTNHFRIARGSASEVVAAYELAVALGEPHDIAAITQTAARVSAMLFGLIKRPL